MRSPSILSDLRMKGSGCETAREEIREAWPTRFIPELSARDAHAPMTRTRFKWTYAPRPVLHPYSCDSEFLSLWRLLLRPSFSFVKSFILRSTPISASAPYPYPPRSRNRRVESETSKRLSACMPPPVRGHPQAEAKPLCVCAGL